MSEVRVTGRARSSSRVGLGGLHVEVVDHDLGAVTTLGTATTDDDGGFTTSVPTQPGKTRPDLQARLWSGVGDDAVMLGQSDLTVDVEDDVELDIVLADDATGLTSEFSVLTAALDAVSTERGSAVAGDEPTAIAYLARKTRWDARAIALAVSAERLAVGEDHPDAPLPPALVYALLRAGLPADPTALFRTDPDLVERTWRTAAARGVVDGGVVEDIPAARAAFVARGVAVYRTTPGASGGSDPDRLLRRTFGDDDAAKQRFAELRMTAGDDLDAFWTEVGSAFGPATRDELRLVGKLAALTLDAADVVDALLDAEAATGDPLRDPADLAVRGYGRAERWAPLLDGRAIGPGPGEEGHAPVDAEVLAAQVRLRYPSRALAERVRSGRLLSAVDGGRREAVATFLEAHDDRFDFATVPVRRHVDDLARRGEEVPPDVVTEVARIQRVFHLTPHDQALDVLVEAGLDSAQAIARHRPEELVARLADAVPEADVRLVHSRAVQRHQALLAVAMAYGTARTAPVLGAAEGAPLLDARPATGAAFDAASGVLAYPTLEGLFGSMDLRSCDHCRSVLSPAAYLVDLLTWLDRPDLGAGNPLAVLLGRRPDIEHLALTCENTDTTLPYIDLVNEALEHMVVARGHTLAEYGGHDTDPAATVDDLLARPRNVDERAYAALASAELPPPLPFDRSRERLRRLFDRFGVSLADAMEALRSDEGIDGPDPASTATTDDGYGWRHVWFERLGISRGEAKVLTAPDTSIAAILGYPSTTTPDAVARDLSTLGALARRLDVTYEELLALRVAKSVSPSGPLRIHDPGSGGAPTPFGRLQLRASNGSALAPADVLRLARFVRLWRRLGWSIAELDTALVDLHPHTDTGITLPTRGDVIFRLAIVATVADRLGVRADERPAFLRTWARSGSEVDLLRRLGLGWDEHEGLSEWVELSLRSLQPTEAPEVIEALDLLDALKAVGLSLAEALLIVWGFDVTGAGADVGGDVDALARSLRAAQDGVTRDLAGDATDPDRSRAQLALVVGPEAADAFVGLIEGAVSVSARVPSPVDLPADVIRRSRGRLTPDQGGGRLGLVGAFDASIAAAFATSTVPATAVDALRTASAERAASDASFATSGGRVEALLDGHPQLETALVAWATTAGGPELARAAALTALLTDSAARRRRDAALTTVAAAIGADPALVEAIVADRTVLHAHGDTERPALDDIMALATVDDAATGVDAQSQGALEAPQARAVRLGMTVADGSEGSIDLDGTRLALELQGGRHVTAGPVALVAGTLHRIAVQGRQPTRLWWQLDGRPWELVPARHLYGADRLDDLRATVTRLGRANALAAAAGLTTAELLHLAVDPTLAADDVSWLNALPGVAPPEDNEALRRPVQAVLELARLKAAFADDGGRVTSVLARPAAPTAGTDELLALTRWDSTALTAVLARLRLDRARLTDVFVLGRVERAMAVIGAFGVDAGRVLAATTDVPTAAQVDALEAALRARYGPTAWLVVQRAISDDLRDVQRDALVSFVLRRFADLETHRHIDTPDKLYEHMLMDVQMEACAQTSRIRHAIATVQLFVERALMNLEPAVPPDVIPASQWAWMKRYRVWEANRKVYLWPENWLEPALRREQSIPYRTTMGQLLQGDVNEDTAAAGLLGYLSSLAEVAQLEPCGVHHHEGRPEVAGDEVTHVVARTPGAPRRYHHRRRDLGSWTPWEPIDVDIEDNPVVPVVWRGRLFLFWVRLLQANPGTTTATTSSDQTDLASMPYGSARQEGAKTVKLTPQVVLCWSEHYDGGWLPARTSDVARPASFARSYDMTAGNNAFDRAKLVMGESYERDAVRIRIWSAEVGASYLVLNTHGLPVRQEDRPAPALTDNLAASRQLAPSGPSFSVTYTSNPTVLPIIPAVTRRLFAVRDAFRTVAPFPIAYLPTGDQTSSLRDPWVAPFFFSDSRHVFHVRTGRGLVTFADHDDFGTTAARPEPGDIPSLLRLGADDLAFDVVLPPSPDDPRSIPFERVIPAGTDVHTVIASSAEVQLAGHPFGPTGGTDA